MRSINEIENLRNASGISKAELCRMAGHKPEVYRRLISGKSAGHWRTMENFNNALNYIVESRLKAMR